MALVGDYVSQSSVQASVIIGCASFLSIAALSYGSLPLNAQFVIFVLASAIYIFQISCGRKQSGSYLDGAAPDGVMGLGPGTFLFLVCLQKQG